MPDRFRNIALAALCGALCTAAIYTSEAVIAFGAGFLGSQGISEAVPYGATLGFIFGAIFAWRGVPAGRAALWQGLVTGMVQVLLRGAAAVIVKLDATQAMSGVLIIGICINGLGGAASGAVGVLLYQRARALLPAS